VLDLAIEKGKLVGTVEAVERKPKAVERNDRLYVLWSAVEKPIGFAAIGKGAVYVREAEMAAKVLSYQATPNDLGDHQYHWGYQTLGPLMVVLLLPPEHGISNCRPSPHAAKRTADGRLAVYWKFKGSQQGDDAELYWTVEKCDNIDAAAQQINKRFRRKEEIPTVVVDQPSNATNAPTQAPLPSPIPQPGHWIGYLIFAVVCLIIALGVGFYLISHLQDLRQGQAFDQAYYILVVIMGVAVAFAVFGGMRSSAALTGNYPSLAFQVGGPAVAVVLVVAGAFYLPGPTQNVDLIVRLSGPDDTKEMADGAGAIITAGRFLQTLTFDKHGQTVVVGLPPTVRQDGVKIHFRSPRYKPVQDGEDYKLDRYDTVTIKLKLTSP
jgi:hypothetical protein